MPTAKRTSRNKRQRRTPAAARNAMLEAARDLLLRSGPQAITLPAIAKRLGMTHGNITHHFGSVRALHAALVDQMARGLASAVVSAVTQLRNEGADPIKVVDTLFDAFAQNDAGRLISWLASTGDMEALEPLFAAVSQLVRELSQGVIPQERELGIRHNSLVLIATALGNALIGERLHAAVGLPAGTLNKLSAKDLLRRAYPPPASRQRR